MPFIEKMRVPSISGVNIIFSAVNRPNQCCNCLFLLFLILLNIFLLTLSILFKSFLLNNILLLINYSWHEFF